MIDVEMLRPTADEMLSGLSANPAMRQRILLRSKAPQMLPAVADEMLGGLHATPALRHRILVAAERKARKAVPAVSNRETAKRRPAYMRFVPAAGMALVMAFMIGLGVNYNRPDLLPQAINSPVAQTDLASYMAGEGDTPAGETTQHRSIFEGEGANPPLIGVNGRFYRMTTVPVQPDVLGSAIAEVQDFTDEPSLATTVGVVSNIAKEGTQVYAVDGLSAKTACIAEIDGVPRLFQRIGYAGETIVGNELFEDTLDINGQVAALELSGVGRITDETSANELIYMLSEFAVYNGNDVPDSDQSLTIYLHNGLSLQLMVQDDVLGGCGAWACPEFFDAFEAAL